jgi:hypothetical protein
MRSLPMVVMVLALAACGGAQANRGGEAEANAGANPGSGAVTGPAEGGLCPDTFAVAREVPVDCHHPSFGPCAFPEGRCECELEPLPCQGVAPDPTLPPRPRRSVWTCRPTPPALHPKGCPGMPPADGSACAPDGLRCAYGECHIVPYECRGGAWHEGSVASPPSIAR